MTNSQTDPQTLVLVELDDDALALVAGGPKIKPGGSTNGVSENKSGGGG